MTEMSFVKPYPDARIRVRAEANYHWLNHLAFPPRLPRLLAATPHSLAFEHIHGRHADLGDLIDIAAHVGDLHGSAYRTDLCGYVPSAGLEPALQRYDVDSGGQ